MSNINSNHEKEVAIAQHFENWYESLQKNIPVVSLDPIPENKYLVQGNTNNSIPIHRWYSLKESYSEELPRWIIRHIKTKYNVSPQSILDPFVGGGTTGVSLGLEGFLVYGIEYNPFIRYVANTKSSASRIQKKEFEKAVKKLSQADFAKVSVEVPEMSTFLNQNYVSRKNLRNLLASQALIDKLQASTETKALMRLGVAASIETAFNLRKDGRALRYLPNKAVDDVRKVIFHKYDEILVDLEILQRNKALVSSNIFQVLAGSALDLNNLRLNDQCFAITENQVDAVIYSPPYLNNFDYSEVYKLELWLMGFVKTYTEWRNLRLGTLRSHPSVKFSETSSLSTDSKTRAIHNKLVEMGQSSCIPEHRKDPLSRTFLGYFDDMYLCLKEQFRVMQSGGILCYVVANSRHYYLPIATDVILAEIAKCIGFEPLELVALRKRNGRTRQKAFLRESAVFLRKP